jgi:protein-S-isoprenylcysteine O-methyltransferase Ste14
MESEAAANLRTRAFRRMLTTVVILSVMLFASAGSWRFWQAWLYVGVMSAFWFYFFHRLLKHSHELLERRMRRDEADHEQRLFQKLFPLIAIAAFVLTGFDYRFGWSRAWLGSVPIAAVLAAQALTLAGYWFVFWVMKTNAFASSTIQVESGQTVIQSGPYALVRHPMYLGMTVMLLASPLALGSYVALPVFAMFIPALIYRLIHEEQTLRRDLAGYAEYCERVQCRLIPYTW